MSVGLKEKNFDDKKKPTRYFSKLQETKVAKDLGGTRTKNSGATDFGGKSDVFIHDRDNGQNWSIECKTKMTHTESMSIKKEWLEKLKREAMFDGNKYCALAFNFGPNEENYYIIDQYLFQDLMEYLKNKKA